MSYRPDARTLDELIADTKAEAEAIPVPGLPARADASIATWGHVLDEDEMSFGLIRELLQAHHGLLDHLADVPKRAQRYWLEETCGIQALDTLAAWGVVVAEVADGAGPILVEAGTGLKGPKDAAGAATTFATADNLVATGTTVQAVRSFAQWSDTRSAADEALDGLPIVPFGSAAARHEMLLCSELLASDGGALIVTLDFSGPSIDVAPLADLDWTFSTADGEATTTAVAVSSSQITMTLPAGCSPLPVVTDLGSENHHFLRAAANVATLPGVLGLSYTEVEISVSRDGVVPDGAFYNDGIVDIEREFKPFGDVPRRGDSFYLQSEEALAKPLASLSVQLTPLDDGEYNALQPVLLIAYVITDTDGSLTFEPVPPRIDWQIRQDGSWSPLRESNNLVSLTNVAPPQRGDDPAADSSSLAGIDGRFIRAFLSGGDFGWDAYQENLVSFANTVAGLAGANTAMPVAPKPPTLRSATVAYETKKVAVDRVVAVNGFSRREVAGGVPFAHPVIVNLGAVPAAAVHIGIDVPEAALGQTLSFWFAVDSTAACSPSAGEDLSRWEVWNGATWDRLSVSDSSDSLRTSGLVRFVAPRHWPLGCQEAGAVDGRWMRLATNQPDRIGSIQAVLPDAVRAVATPGPTGLVADLTAPDAGSVKGPTTRIDGIKKITNPYPSQGSRPAETDNDYVERAPQVMRTRNRLIQPVDYELDILANFPEIAFVSCLPHFDGTDTIAPGHVGLVVVPDIPDPAPLPSADLVSRVEKSVARRAPMHAAVAVHCPSYRKISVSASIVLTRGEAALTAQDLISNAVDRWLHPVDRSPGSLGKPIYRSEVISLIEDLSIVDRVETLDLSADDGAVVLGPSEIVERVDPPTPRRLGMVVSSGIHALELTEQLA